MKDKYIFWRLNLCVVLGGLVWLWPFTAAPIYEFWPGYVAIGFGAIVVCMLPSSLDARVSGIAFGWLLAATVNALIALFQYFDLVGGLQPWVLLTWAGNPQGNVHQVNHLATLLAVGILVLFWVRRNQKISEIVFSCVGTLLVVAMASTSSRTGMLQIILIAVFVVWWSKDRRPLAIKQSLRMIAIYCLATVLLPWLLKAILGIEGRDLLGRLSLMDSSCHSRLVLWKNVLHLISLKPWTGWGWGELSYAHYMTLYDGLRFCENPSNAHSLPLHLAATLGLPVSLLIMFCFLGVLLKVKPWQDSCPTRQLAWGVLALIGLHSLLEYPLWFGNFQVMCFLCTLLLWTRADEKSYLKGEKPVIGKGKWKLNAAMVVIAGVSTYIAVDYYRVSQLYAPINDRTNIDNKTLLEDARSTILFLPEVLFVQIASSEVGNENAEFVLSASLLNIHTNPVPIIIEKIIASASLLENTILVNEHKARYKAAYPKQYEKWENLDDKNAE